MTQPLATTTPATPPSTDQQIVLLLGATFHNGDLNDPEVQALLAFVTSQASAFQESLRAEAGRRFPGVPVRFPTDDEGMRLYEAVSDAEWADGQRPDARYSARLIVTTTA